MHVSGHINRNTSSCDNLSIVAPTDDAIEVLVQARTNHSYLQEFKARIARAQSAECRCTKARETIEHVLLTCQLWDHLRTELRQAAGARWGDISYMRGGYSERKDQNTGKQIEGDKGKWKPNHNMVKATINFLQLTGRMKGSYEEEPRETSSTETRR
jgi:hypothetical protein